VNLILTKRGARYGRAKTAKRGANQFQKLDSYPGLYGSLPVRFLQWQVIVSVKCSPGLKCMSMEIHYPR